MTTQNGVTMTSEEVADNVAEVLLKCSFVKNPELTTNEIGLLELGMLMLDSREAVVQGAVNSGKRNELAGPVFDRMRGVLRAISEKGPASVSASDMRETLGYFGHISQSSVVASRPSSRRGVSAPKPTKG